MINPVYLDRFRETKKFYYITIEKGIILEFDKFDLIYIGIDTIFNVSDKKLSQIEYEGLNKLYRLGWIIWNID